MEAFRHLHMAKNGPYWLKLALWSRLLFCTAFPVHLPWVWLFSLLFWPHTMKQESKFFFEDKAAFYETMNVYFSWEGSHSASLICRQLQSYPSFLCPCSLSLGHIWKLNSMSVLTTDWVIHDHKGSQSCVRK